MAERSHAASRPRFMSLGEQRLASTSRAAANRFSAMRAENKMRRCGEAIDIEHSLKA
jgi:hypothetical protein